MDIPHDADVTSSDIKPGADLSEADLSAATLDDVDLSGADLRGVDLSAASLTNADLSGATLTEADLWETTLSGADLVDADLSEAVLVDADLSGADLRGATLSGANLRIADLSEAALQATDLTDVYLPGTSLTGASLSRRTTLPPPRQRLTEETEMIDASFYDQVARVNHELRTAYSENGLTAQARQARVRECRARRREALADDDWRGTLAWFWSLLSKVVTGYGVQLRWIATVMVLLYVGSTIVYAWTGMALTRSLYYSIVTFTTSPPATPPTGIATAVAGIETFAGTAAIVFLGYVLGTRERV